MFKSRLARIALGIVIGILGAGFFLVHPCTSGGAMGAAYRTCDCRGIEWLISDKIAADGPRRSACLGWVTGRTCYQSRGGPEVPCSEP